MSSSFRYCQSARRESFLMPNANDYNKMRDPSSGDKRDPSPDTTTRNFESSMHEKFVNLWPYSDDGIYFMKKLGIVARYIATCKEHIASIIIQIITLFHDTKVMDIKFEPRTGHQTSMGKLTDSYQGWLTKEMENTLMYLKPKLSRKILEMVFNFLIEDTTLAGIKPHTHKMSEMIQVVFRSITTVENDPYMKSLRVITVNHVEYNKYLKQEAEDFLETSEFYRKKLLTILDILAIGGFDTDSAKLDLSELL